jgi:hypothetical protein
MPGDNLIVLIALRVLNRRRSAKALLVTRRFIIMRRAIGL